MTGEPAAGDHERRLGIASPRPNRPDVPVTVQPCVPVGAGHAQAGSERRPGRTTQSDGHCRFAA